MDVLSPVVAAEPGPERCAPSAEAELARLRAHVAWLEAERAALWWAATHDELTGLANRRLFCTLAPPLMCAERPSAVVVLDLNGFKPINDALGHEVGDRVLQIVAQRMVSCVGHDLVARLGGDEFTSVLTSPHRQPCAQWWRPAVIALAAAIAEPMPVAGHLLSVTASVGVALACEEILIGELLRQADLAMYQAKASGSRYALWDRHGVDGVITPRASRIVEIALAHPVDDPADEPAAPTREPHRRDPAAVAPAGTYKRNDPVWVYRQGAWRPGVVESASHRAVMATYRSAAGSGTGVDTMTPEYVLARHATDPQLDRRDSDPVAAA
jgi:diguanylate cyclase (GGDEF)-like protein